MNILLRHMGQGKFETATSPDRVIAGRIPNGEARWFEFKQSRSQRQNRFIHAIFQQAWENQRQEKWDSAAHLKQAALVAVGHCQSWPIEKKLVADWPMVLDLVANIVRTVSDEDRYVFIADAGDHIQFRTALRWRFEKLAHEDATRLMDPILAWLCSDEGPLPGTDPEALADEARKMAI